MRPDNSNPLTADEHAELGREIRTIAARMVELERLVTSVYGPASRTSFSFVKTVEAIEHLRDVLDLQSQLDLPGLHDGRFYR